MSESEQSTRPVPGSGFLIDQFNPSGAIFCIQAEKAQRAIAAGDESERKDFLTANVVKVDTRIGARHFSGSEVIDGQQRLMTLQVVGLSH